MRFWTRSHLVSFVLALIVMGAGFVVWKFYHPTFKAHARLQVMEHVPRVLFHTVEIGGKEDYKRYQNTQQALVRSQLALSAALRDSEVSKYRMIRELVDPIGWLQDNLKVEFIADSELMEISLTGEDPRELAGIVNAVKTAYIEEVVNVDIKMRPARYDQLKKLKAEYAEGLKERRENLRKLVDTTGGDPGRHLRGFPDQESGNRRISPSSASGSK